jgi:uncharacterized protein (DUF342 family)
MLSRWLAPVCAPICGRHSIAREKRDSPSCCDRVAVQINGGTQEISVAIEPVREGNEIAYGIVFTDRGPPRTQDEAASLRSPDSEDAAVQQIERELQETRERLQSTIEELETANEEFRPSNEELLSVNEELQSTNEELETSKEELQSVNEILGAGVRASLMIFGNDIVSQSSAPEEFADDEPG